jgi:RND family efflux transporter MFP subunit
MKRPLGRVPRRRVASRNTEMARYQSKTRMNGGTETHRGERFDDAPQRGAAEHDESSRASSPLLRCSVSLCHPVSAVILRVLHAIAVASLFLAPACSHRAAEEEEAKPAEVPTITAETAKVTRRTLVDELVVRGVVTAVPNEDVKVSALVAGRVNAVAVAEGDSVKQGQTIAELDPQPLQDQRRQAAAAVEQAKAQVENARLNLQRNQQLFERGIAAGKEVEDAKAQFAQAEAALEQGTATLNTANRNIERAAVRSPISGQVVKRMVSVGEQVDGTAAQPIVEIANLDRVELAANVPAEHLPRIRVNQTATIVSDAAGTTTFRGAVIAIAPAVDATTNAALVRVRIANPAHVLKVGVFAEARVVIGEHENAIVVPPAALVRDARGAAVYVASGDMASRAEVKVGLEKPDAVEILSGVKEGDTVLVSSVYGLGEKAKLAK